MRWLFHRRNAAEDGHKPEEMQSEENGGNHMGRKRMEQPSLKSWDDVNSALKVIVDAENALEAINLRLDEQIAVLKEEAETAAKEYKDTIKKYELQLKEYAIANRGEFTQQKSKILTFGKIGFRFSTKLVLPKVLDNVIHALRKEKMDECIVTKETVDKEALKQYPEEKILEVGGALKKEDCFFYETNHDEIAATI